MPSPGASCRTRLHGLGVAAAVDPAAPDDPAALRRAVDELTFLQRLARVSAATLDPDALCALVIRETCDVLGVEVCSLYLVEDGELVLAATNGLNPAGIGRARMPVGVGITGTAALSARVVGVRDVAADPRFHWIDGLDQERFTSMCSVPLIAEGSRVIGVLNVQTAQPCDWTEEDTTMLVAIAAQLAGTIERSHLQRQLELRLEQSRAVSSAIAALVPAAQPVEIANLLVTHAAGCADPVHGEAVLWLLEGGDPRVTAVHPPGKSDADEAGGIGESLVQLVAREGRAQRLVARGAGAARFMIVAPVRARQGVRGVLAAWSGSEERMRDRDIDLFQTIADQGGLALDNAETRVAEREATEHWRRLTQARSDLLSAVSHDLRTPLGVVLTYAGALRYEASGVQRDVIDQVIDELQRMERMVGTMLMSLAMEAGAVPLRRQPTDLCQLIRSTCGAVSATTLSRRLDIVVPDEPVVCDADADSVRRVLENLLTNAAEHAPIGTHVVVTLSRRSSMAEISVTDQGVGVAAADRALIFQRARRAGRSASGTGVGLFVVRTIAEAHGGAVGVETPPHGGARFWVRLPLSVRAAAA